MKVYATHRLLRPVSRTIIIVLIAILQANAQATPDDSPKTTIPQFQQLNGAERYAVLQGCVGYIKKFVADLPNDAPEDPANHRMMANFIMGNFDPDPNHPSEIPDAYNLVDSFLLHENAASIPLATACAEGFGYMDKFYLEDSQKGRKSGGIGIVSWSDKTQIESFRYWTQNRYIADEADRLQARIQKLKEKNDALHNAGR